MNQNKKYLFLIVCLVLLIAGGYVYYSKFQPSPKSNIIDINELIANQPAPNAPQEEIFAYYTKIQTAAIESAAIDVTSCNPSPRIVSIKREASVTLVNNDEVIHTLAFTPSYSVAAFAKTQRLNTLKFADNPGIYPYFCDGKINAGYIVVE